MSDTVRGLDDFRRDARRWLAANLDVSSTRSPHARGTLPTSEDLDQQRHLQRTLFDGGYAGITWPEEYGGRGLTSAHQRAFDEESAGYVLPDFYPLANTTFVVCGPTILAHASAAFKAAHVPRILAGEELWAQFFSEPAAGSDLAGIQTRATRDGVGWVLNGAKVWSSGATLADYGMCLARSDWSVPKHRGLTWFAVPTDAPGLTIRPIRESSGGAEFCEEFIDDVVISDAERIGEVNGGWAVASTMLVFERSAGKLTGDRIGGPPGPLPVDLVELARRRGIEKETWARQEIARVHANDFVQRHLSARVADVLAEAGADSGVAAYLKLAEGVYTAARARSALELAGPGAAAWRQGDDVARTAATSYLNARLRAIAGGTNEMQRNGIGERVLGLPREASVDRDAPFDEVLRRAREWGGR